MMERYGEKDKERLREREKGRLRKRERESVAPNSYSR